MENKNLNKLGIDLGSTTVKIAVLGKNNELNYLSNIKIKCDYTISYLKKIGFEWPEIEDKYIIKYIENIE